LVGAGGGTANNNNGPSGLVGAGGGTANNNGPSGLVGAGGTANNNPMINNNDDPSELIDNNNGVADIPPPQLNNNDDDPLAGINVAPNAPNNNDDDVGMEDAAAAAAADDDTNNNIYMVNGVEYRFRLPHGITIEGLAPFIVVDETSGQLKAGPLCAYCYVRIPCTAELRRDQNSDQNKFDIELGDPTRDPFIVSRAEYVLLNRTVRKCE
jgi:hypothetical protein